MGPAPQLPSFFRAQRVRRATAERRPPGPTADGSNQKPCDTYATRWETQAWRRPERLSTSGLSALDHGARSANRAAERRLQLPVNDLATGAGEPADNLGLATDQRGFSTSLPALARMPFNS